MDATRRAGQATVVVGALLVIAGLAWGIVDSVHDALGGKEPRLVIQGDLPPPRATGDASAQAPREEAPAGKAPVAYPIEPAPPGWPFNASIARYAVNVTTLEGDTSLNLTYRHVAGRWNCEEDAPTLEAVPSKGPPRLTPPPVGNEANLTVLLPGGGCRSLLRLAGPADGPVQVVAPVNLTAVAVDAVHVSGGNATAGWEAYFDRETGLLLAASEWRDGYSRDLHLVATDAPLAVFTGAAEPRIPTG